MTRDQFKKELDKKEYEWREEGEWVVVEETGTVYLNYLKSIPDNVQFRNRGYVYLYSLESIPDNIQFNNGGNVYLGSLKSIPINVQFNNRGNVYLESLKQIPVNLDTEEIFQNDYDIKINGEWLFLENNITFPDSRWTGIDGKVQMYESWIKNNY